MAGYGVRAFLVAQSLHQIDKAYGPNHAILDNCHVRVAFAPNDERTAKRLSDALGTATELRAQRNLSGKRLSAWLSHTSISAAGDAAAAADRRRDPAAARGTRRWCWCRACRRSAPGSSSTTPIATSSTAGCTSPRLSAGAYADVPPPRADDWSGLTRGIHPQLDKAWSELVAADAGREAKLEPDADMARDRAADSRRDDRAARCDDLPEQGRGGRAGAARRRR